MVTDEDRTKLCLTKSHIMLQARTTNKPAQREARGFNRITRKNVKEMTLPQAVDILVMRTTAFRMRQSLKELKDSLAGLAENERASVERSYNEAVVIFNGTMKSFRQKAESYFTLTQSEGGMTPAEQKKFRKLYGDPQKGFENG